MENRFSMQANNIFRDKLSYIDGEQTQLITHTYPELSFSQK